MKTYYITDDTALAAYLYLCGFKFLEGTIFPVSGYRKKYVVVDRPDREMVEEDFYLRRTTCAPMDYHDARIAVSRFLRREIRDPRLPMLGKD